MTNSLRLRRLCGGAILAYIFLSCAAFYFGELAYRLAATIIGVMLFCTVIARSQRFRSLPLLFLLFFPSACVSLINAEWSEFRSIFTLFILISCIGVSLAAFEFKLTKLAFEYVFLFFIGLTFFLVAFYNYGPQEFNRFLYGSSRNVYAALLLASAIGYILSCHYRGKNPSTLLLIAFVCLNYPLYGRSAIAFSIATLLAVLFYYRRSLILATPAVAILIAVLALHPQAPISRLLEGTNFSSGLESERFEILSQYSERLEAAGLVVGNDFTNYPEIREKDGNPHNAFLRLHGYWGVGLLFFAALVIYSQSIAIRDGLFIIPAIASIALSRAFFDIVYFFNLFDYLILPSILYFLYRPFFQTARRERLNAASSNGS